MYSYTGILFARSDYVASKVSLSWAGFPEGSESQFKGWQQKTISELRV